MSVTSSNNWQALFNGVNLEGWQHVGQGHFIVKDGLLITGGGMGLLWYDAQKWGNCSIRVVYKTTHATSNSGVFVCIADKPIDEWYAVHHGYEIQILDDAPDDYHCTGAIYSLAPAKAQLAKPAGEWNTMEIVLTGKQITVNLNGQQVSQLTPGDPTPERQRETQPMRGPRPEVGYIGIQNHDHDAAEPDNHVYFKEISVMTL